MIEARASGTGQAAPDIGRSVAFLEWNELDNAKRGNAVLPFAPAPRETLQDYVYERVKDLILTGDIAPGQSVTINALASAFAVSHMPVREALRRLIAERALTVISGRSVGLPALSVEHLEDLRRVRVEVEGIATEWATRNLSAADHDALAGLVAAMNRADAENDVKGYLHANRDFHFAIYRAARLRHVPLDDREPVAADQPLLQSPARIRRLPARQSRARLDRDSAAPGGCQGGARRHRRRHRRRRGDVAARFYRRRRASGGRPGRRIPASA